MDKKIITRAERQAKIKANADKLNNHINKGVEGYVKDIYEDTKEARKNARWYETGEALVEAKIKGQLDADEEFAEEFTAWAEKQQEEYYTELDASEAKLLEAEDVIDVEFKPLTQLGSTRGRRQSKLISSSTPSDGRRVNTNILPSAKVNNPYASKKKPS